MPASALAASSLRPKYISAISVGLSRIDSISCNISLLQHHTPNSGTDDLHYMQAGLKCLTSSRFACISLLTLPSRWLTVLL